MSDIIKRKGSHLEVMTGLSKQEILFTVELLKDMNPIRAGQACGMDPDEAMRLASKKAIKERCEAILLERLDEAQVDIDWLLYELRDNHTIARQQGNLTASNKSLELLGKLAPVDAFAANKHEHSGEVGLVVNVKRYSDEKVIEGSAEAVKQIGGGQGPNSGADASVSFL